MDYQDLGLSSKEQEKHCQNLKNHKIDALLKVVVESWYPWFSLLCQHETKSYSSCSFGWPYPPLQGTSSFGDFSWLALEKYQIHHQSFLRNQQGPPVGV